MEDFASLAAREARETGTSFNQKLLAKHLHAQLLAKFGKEAKSFADVVASNSGESTRKGQRAFYTYEECAELFPSHVVILHDEMSSAAPNKRSRQQVRMRAARARMYT